MFDPRIGRFLSMDPIGLRGQDLNLFRYVGNSPINNVDPEGLLELKILARQLTGDEEFYEMPPRPIPGINVIGINEPPSGAFYWPADFVLSEPAPCGGVIAQRVRFTLKEGSHSQLQTFWEFWNVKKDERTATPLIPLPILFQRTFFRVFNDFDVFRLGKWNDWYAWLGIRPPKPRLIRPGSVEFEGEAWFVEGNPPSGLPGTATITLIEGLVSQVGIPAGGTQVIGGFVFSNDLLLRLWVAKHAKAGPVPHVYRSRWTETGKTTLVEHKP